MHFKILLCAKASDIKRSLIQVPHSTRTDNGGKFEYHEISVHHYQNRETILSLCSGCCIYRGNAFSFFCFVDIPGSQRHLVDLLFRIKQKGYLPLWQVLNKHLSHFLLSTVFSKPQIKLESIDKKSPIVSNWTFLSCKKNTKLFSDLHLRYVWQKKPLYTHCCICLKTFDY